MTYKQHVYSVIEQLKKFAVNEDTDTILLKNHLEGIIQDIDEEKEYTKWSCNSCGHRWYSGHFETYIECPKCESVDMGHH